MTVATEISQLVIFGLEVPRLLVGKQRSTLAILLNDLAALEGITAEKTRNADRQREDEQDTTDREGEDPLELKDRYLGEELAHSGRESKNRELKANGVVLECSEEEQAISQNAPDEDVRNNARDQILGMLVDSNSANPVKRDEVPGQRSANSSNVNETGGSAVAEVCQGQIGKVDHEE